MVLLVVLVLVVFCVLLWLLSAGLFSCLALLFVLLLCLVDPV